MTQLNQQLDLSQLAVDREKPETPPLRASRSWGAKYVLPIGILVGFLCLFGWAARESLLPAQAVTVTPVVLSQAKVTREGTPLFQAAGWVEPRPTPVVASSLAPGVIRDVLVIEGQQVEEGEAVALLIDADAKIALSEAQANEALQQAEVRRAEATLIAAKTNFAKPVTLRAALAEAEARLAEIQMQLGNLPFAIEAARTQQELSAENVRRKELAGGAITGRVLREARAELANATNAVKELAAREPTLKTQMESLSQKRDALAEKLQLLTEEKRAVAEAEASLAITRAKLQQTKLAVEAAQLRLNRMTVRAPITGRVLSVEARPGQRLSGINPHSEQGSSAVVSLYDPASLQVRVDVRLEDVPQVQLGQPAQIETAALSGPISGEVISVTTRADIQKNTLQVKVAVSNPPEVIKPEMLAKVTFLAPASPVDEGDEESAPLRLLIPEPLVTRGESGASVLTADLTAGVARRKSVSIASGVTDGGLVEVINGLLPTDKLIVDGKEQVEDGTRIRVTGESRSQSSAAPIGGRVGVRTASTQPAE